MSISLLGFLGVAFTVLKLLGTITWSWWWVLLPFYGPLVFWAIVVLLAMRLTDWDWK